MKRILLFAALALLVAGCGDDAAASGAGGTADLNLAGVEFVVHQAPG